jgi:hypothetical protein
MDVSGTTRKEGISHISSSPAETTISSHTLRSELLRHRASLTWAWGLETPGISVSDLTPERKWKMTSWQVNFDHVFK